MFLFPRSVCSIALVGAAALTLSGCGGGSPTPAAPAPPGAIAAHYTIIPLGILPGFNNSSGAAVNSQGQVAGLCYQAGLNVDSTAFQNFRAFLYAGGGMHDLGVPTGYTSSTGDGIDDAGDVVLNTQGSMTVSGVSVLSRHPFLSHGGALTSIVTPDATQSGAVISGNGQIAGAAQTASGYHTFLNVGGTPKDLGVPPGYTDCIAVAINGIGDVVGTANMGTDPTTSHAALYHAGIWTDLGTLGTGYSQAEGLNDSGQVTGSSGTAAARHAFLYSQGKMQDLTPLPGYVLSQGNAVNNQGIVVCASFGAGTPAHAFIYAQGRTQDLNALLPASSGWVLQSANGINSAGQIVGDGVYQGQGQAFLLSPTS